MGFKCEICVSICLIIQLTTSNGQTTPYKYFIDNTIDNFSAVVNKSEAISARSDYAKNSNRKPVFRGCENYKPTVKEEQPAGTYVFTVKADDADPVDAGGTVTYRIIKRDGERAYFSVDNVTGIVTTTSPFDRDEPSRQTDLYITIQATDNGWPNLADICTIKVTVIDINDNSPSFDKFEYNTKASEDLKPNSKVMTVFAYDIDEGENSRLSYNFSDDNKSAFTKYFRIDRETGTVYLEDSLAGKKDTKFTSSISVCDNGVLDDEGSKCTKVDVSITIVGSDKQLPRFVSIHPEGDIILFENFSEFSKPLVTIEASSSIEDKEVVFELVKGKTSQTNKDQTFLLVPENTSTTAHIKLVRPLDYETVTEYTLTVRIKNKDSMDASVNIPIKIKDVNDEYPTFLEYLRGSIVENDVIGVQAIQVRAIDKDGTSPNNIVKYELMDNTDIFAIDENTGVITSNKVFDREITALYHVKIMAYDGAPSALVNSGEPNKVEQTFQISIEDQNDNKPQFTKSIYYFSNISESAGKGHIVGEVEAKDNDTASLITYSIIGGNIDEAFYIENTTGRIRVNNGLNFEIIEQYSLTVRAFDGQFEDRSDVKISILNENDEVPVFGQQKYKVELMEEQLVEGCIVRVSAYDPDIKDRNADQKIVFELDKKQSSFVNVSRDGCVSLIKTLNRDPPDGAPTAQTFICALDNEGGTNALRACAELEIELIDINDNAPFLNVTEIVWYENKPPGLIGQLSAHDYDSPINGPPFTFKLKDTTPEDIQEKFSISDDELYAKVTFDREEQKYYDVPINITDSGSPPLSGVSILRVIIGDVNDNAAKDGESSIFVYKYVNGPLQDIEIGRVFVDDPDDWDLNDKVFVQQNEFEQFGLNQSNNGMILLKPNTQEGSYIVNYEVTETHEPNIPRHTVNAVVNITVKEIIEEAVRKSGSIRMMGVTAEEFVLKENGVSKKDILQQRISKIVNTSIANVDVFTVIQSPSNSFVDVRFSAHGSPYYAPEKLENKITEHEENIENQLGVTFYMVGINECLNDTICGPQCSCTNVMNIKKEPAVVFTNRTSFVGVNAVIDPICEFEPKEILICFNGGTMDNGFCICPAGFEGPHCEILAIGFNSDGWAMYPTLEASNKSEIVVHILPQSENGLIFYVGPLIPKHARIFKDFISLELRDGYPLLLFNAGNVTEQFYLNQNIKKLNDGALHKIKIDLSDTVLLEVDDCKSHCTIWESRHYQGVVKANGPLQIGGTKFKFTEEEYKNIWDHPPPTNIGFSGCIRNFTFNSFYYNLGAPSDSYHAYPDCNYGVMQAVTFGIDSNFLVAILVCIAILIILLLAVVVHRRKQDSLNEKEIDDTRENIINYEDEGGGECDTNNCDMSVLRQMIFSEEKPVMRENPNVPADISGFLDTKKDSCDKDPDNLPYDDVRHYAYEGDGNSTGSLSSLASCTDEGDLKFNYLSSFGPRFRKLADMYGEDPSDEDSRDGGEESWC